MLNVICVIVLPAIKKRGDSGCAKIAAEGTETLNVDGICLY